MHVVASCVVQRIAELRRQFKRFCILPKLQFLSALIVLAP